MHFHHYHSLRPSRYAGSAEQFNEELLIGRMGIRSLPSSSDNEYVGALVEKAWRLIGRPYYNVYPIVETLCRKTTLCVPWESVCFPFSPLLFRFAAGHEPHGISAAIVFPVPPPDVPGFDFGDLPAFDRNWATAAQDGNFRSIMPKAVVRTTSLRKEARQACSYIMSKNLCCVVQFAAQPAGSSFMWSVRAESWSETVEQTMQDPHFAGVENCKGIDASGASNFLARLSVLAALVGQGQDLITPEVLAKDQARYDKATVSEKQWIEGRASRVNGRGFSFGKQLQRNSDRSPHWRNPHMALFWTGRERSVPVLKLRSGCVVTSVPLADIPTGFLDNEPERGLGQSFPALAYRIAIPKRLRFFVMRRDMYRCRLCGLSADDGVKLEVDHKVPVAKGGKTTPENLWTLCHPCNNGKSDSDLTIGEEPAA